MNDAQHLGDSANSGPDSSGEQHSNSMQFGDGAPAYSTSQHPPTVAGPIMTNRPGSSWSNIIGIVYLVFGIMGILSLLGSAAWAVVVPTFLKGVDIGNNPTMQTSIKQAEDNLVLTVALSLFGVLIASMLTYAGARIYQQRVSGVTWAKRWAVIKSFYAIGSSIYAVVIGMEQVNTTTQQMATQGGPGAGVAMGMMVPMMIGSVAFGLLWSMALPIFTLVWFHRVKVRQDILYWPDASNAANPGSTPESAR